MLDNNVYKTFDIIDQILEHFLPHNDYKSQNAIMQIAIDAVLEKFGNQHISKELKNALMNLYDVEFEE